MFVILSALVFFTGVVIFVFPALIVGIKLTESEILISYFGITVKSIPYSRIMYVGRGFWSGSDFRGIVDGLLTMRVGAAWTTKWVLIKLKPGSGFFRNWVFYLQDPDGFVERIRANLSVL